MPSSSHINEGSDMAIPELDLPWNTMEHYAGTQLSKDHAFRNYNFFTIKML